jgi:hypothetical protein
MRQPLARSLPPMMEPIKADNGGKAKDNSLILAPADLVPQLQWVACVGFVFVANVESLLTMHAIDARSHLGKKSLASAEKRVTKKNLTEIEASRKSAALGSIINVFGANRLTRS